MGGVHRSTSLTFCPGSLSAAAASATDNARLVMSWDGKPFTLDQG